MQLAIPELGSLHFTTPFTHSQWTFSKTTNLILCQTECQRAHQLQGSGHAGLLHPALLLAVQTACPRTWSFVANIWLNKSFASEKLLAMEVWFNTPSYSYTRILDKLKIETLGRVGAGAQEWGSAEWGDCRVSLHTEICRDWICVLREV